jgi:hypothetical protein
LEIAERKTMIPVADKEKEEVQRFNFSAPSRPEVSKNNEFDENE